MRTSTSIAGRCESLEAPCAVLVLLLVLAVVGGIVALVQRNRAEDQAHISRSRELAATARLKLEDHPTPAGRRAGQHLPRTPPAPPRA